MNTFEKIYEVVSKVPKGKVVTYGQVAKLIHTNPRVVGFAMHGNKDTLRVPCHRVVSIDGTLRGYAHGLALKKELLIKEGIHFINETTIDLAKHLHKISGI